MGCMLLAVLLVLLGLGVALVTGNPRLPILQPAPTATVTPTPTPGCPDCGSWEAVGQLDAPDLGETSGIVISRANPGIMWAHNDSGGQAALYALDLGGHLIRRFEVSGPVNNDWEDIALGPGPEPGADYVYIGDVGDNLAQRERVQIIRVAEPHVDGPGEPAKLDGAATFELRYPDGAQDAEALVIDPQTARPYIITKRVSAPRVYRAATDLDADGVTSLERVVTMAAVGPLVTAADVTADGLHLALRTYSTVYQFERPANSAFESLFTAAACPIDAYDHGQAEAVAYSPDGGELYTLSEGEQVPIWHLACPRAGQPISKLPVPYVER